MINSDNQKFSEIRFDWGREEILEILNYPLIDLMWEAQIIHRRYNQYKVQLASLFSVKTGGCEENCSYCSQSIYSSSQIKSHPQFCFVAGVCGRVLQVCSCYFPILKLPGFELHQVYMRHPLRRIELSWMQVNVR